jgi:hypothetical protein
MDNRKWGWAQDGSEQADGPYDCREEAIAAAIDDLCSHHAGDRVDVLIGRCEPVDVVKTALRVADYDRNILDDMEESQIDNFTWHDDAIFEVKNEKRAREMWNALVELWASAYVYSNLWTFDETEKCSLYIANDDEEICPICYGTNPACQVCRKLTDHEQMLAEALGCHTQEACCHSCHGTGFVPSKHDGNTGYECPNCKGKKQ